MALLEEGVKYGLSSQENTSERERKTIIFVKLTDSALRAIEDYLHIQQKTGQHATLQFLGSEGRIHIPSSHANDGHSFDFSLSNNAEIEGPQGSFECIQQCGSRSLESMGPLPFKMRIHAKDDVYDLTRQRINFVEDKRKKDCAKEIKQPNADNGRKVKKKLGGIQLPLSHRRETSPVSNYSSSKPSSLLGSNSNNGKSSNGYSNNGNYYGGNHSSNNYNKNNVNTHSKALSSKTSHGINMDITRRPLRERLIHMLALKPLKKPELMTKLHKDGMKDKEKKMLMVILQQVSQLKDNVYNLSRGIWNDVMEDWPFYTEEERQIMKRRKPQNLTPPGSDCSVGSGTSGSSSSPRSTTSGSGHSPTSCFPYPTSGPIPTMGHHNSYSSSNHSGQPMKHSSNYSSHNSSSNSSNGNVSGGGAHGVKRPGVFDTNNGLLEGIGSYDNIPSKKLRVSNFKRPNCSNGNSANNVRIDSKDSPSKELLPHGQRSGGSSGMNSSHSSVVGGSIGGNQERLSPSGIGLAPHNNNTFSNQKSPKNIKDHHSPPYNNNSNINNHSNTSYHHHHPNNQSQGNYGEDSSPINNSSWSSGGRSGHHGTQPNLNLNHNSMQDNGFGRDMKLPDSDETDSIDSGNGSVCSGNGSQHQSTSCVNASINNNNNNNNNNSTSGYHGSKHNGIFSNTSSSSSSSSHTNNSLSTTDLVENCNNNNNNGVNLNTLTSKRERDFSNSNNNNNLLSGCNRVTSTTSNGNGSGFHSTPQSSPDSQIEQSRQHQLQNQWKNPKISEHPKEIDEEDHSVVKSGHGWSAGSNNNNSGYNNNMMESTRGIAKDKVKEKSSKDRDRENREKEKTERDCERPTKTVSEPYPANCPTDYTTMYTTIRTLEQRNRYKADFNAEYSEYRDLHSVIDKVSKKFAHLEGRLRKEEKGSERYKVVRDEIISEYTRNKNSKKYTDARRKFAHMHEKLSHIKRLVLDYDNAHSSANDAGP